MRWEYILFFGKVYLIFLFGEISFINDKKLQIMTKLIVDYSRKVMT